MNIKDLDTPCLLLDVDRLDENLKHMQAYANTQGVNLRPHSKTHKMSYVARKQVDMGAVGITVAKVSEAETFAKEGFTDIFIANEFMGDVKFRRILELSKKIELSFGVDSMKQLERIESIFSEASVKANVLIEIEVGEKRSGIIAENDFIEMINYIKNSRNIHFKGVFSHDGHSYHADSNDDCLAMSLEAQKRTLHFASLAVVEGVNVSVVSIGSTPPHILGVEILEGITEIRPGTYALMDASQANVLGHYDRCAASVLTTVISKPTVARVILDVGSKGLTMQSRHFGICRSSGLGDIKNHENIYIHEMFDEHGIIYDICFSDIISLGDKLEIFPVHICPVCNLYDTAYLVSEGKVIKEIDVTCRGKLK